jgi:hypothetical protein
VLGFNAVFWQDWLFFAKTAPAAKNCLCFPLTQKRA